MADRGAMLNELTMGRKLRPTVTVDKSKPVIRADGEELKKYVAQQNAAPPPPPPQCGPPQIGPPAPPLSAPPPPPPSMSNGHKNNVRTKSTSIGYGQAKAQMPVNRDALLEQIKGGIKLKKVQTVDKSQLKPTDEHLDVKPVVTHVERSPAPIRIERSQAPIHLDRSEAAPIYAEHMSAPIHLAPSPPPLPVFNVNEQKEKIPKAREGNIMKELQDKMEKRFTPNPQMVSDSYESRQVVAEPNRFQNTNNNNTRSIVEKCESPSFSSASSERSASPVVSFTCKPVFAAPVVSKVVRDRWEPADPIPIRQIKSHQQFSLAADHVDSSDLQTPAKLRSAQEAIRKSVESEKEDKDEYHLKSSLLFTEMLKEKLESHPQPSYTLKKPNDGDAVDLKSMMHTAMLVTLPQDCITSEKVADRYVVPPSNGEHKNEPLNYSNGSGAKTETVNNVLPSSQKQAYPDEDNTVRSAYPNFRSMSATRNGQPADLHKAKMVVPKELIAMPKEHIIKIERLTTRAAAENSQRPTDSWTRVPDRTMSSSKDSGLSSSKDNISYISKTLPRRVFDDNSTGFARATLCRVGIDSSNHSHIRHNSDPNLLDMEEGNSSDSELSSFRKVFPKVSQLRNRFENSSESLLSTKSSPTEMSPSPLFVCKPVMAGPVSPEHQQRDHAPSPSYSYTSGGNLSRKLSSASESSQSSSEYFNPRGFGARPNHVTEVWTTKKHTVMDNGRNRMESVPNAVTYVAQPVITVGKTSGTEPADAQSMHGTMERRGYSVSSEGNRESPSLTTWKVRKDSVPQKVKDFSVAKSLEEIHNRHFEVARNGADSRQQQRPMINGGMAFDDAMDAEVAKLAGLSLEDMKQFRFQIDLQDPERTLLLLQKRLFQQQH